MKKFIAFLLVCAFMLSMAITASASDVVKKNDSLNISSDELDKLMIESPNSQVVKKYNTVFRFVFPETSSIDEVLRIEGVGDQRYMIFEGDKLVSYQRLQEGKTEKILSDNPAWDIVYERELEFVSKMRAGNELLSKISSDIEVSNVYYFYDTAYLGSCIYYETNLGDYVYYKSYISSSVASAKKNNYLFPAADFVEMITRVANWWKEHPDWDGGSYDIADYMDVSKYDMDSPSFDVKPLSNTSVTPDNGNGADNKPTFYDNKLAFWGTIAAAGAVLMLAVILTVKYIVKRGKNKAA